MKTFTPIVLLTAAVLLNACGSQTSTNLNGSGNGAQTTATATPSNQSDLPTAPTSTFYVTGQRGTPLGGATATYQGINYSPFNFFTQTPIGTEATLNVLVSPFSSSPVINPNNPSEDANMVNIGCVSFTLWVNGRSFPTQVLAPSGLLETSQTCPNAPNSQLIQMSAGIAGQDYNPQTGLPNPITVSIQANEYDNCWSQPDQGIGYYGCAMTAVGSIHSVSGSIQIQVDGFAPLSQ